MEGVGQGLLAPHLITFLQEEQMEEEAEPPAGRTGMEDGGVGAGWRDGKRERGRLWGRGVTCLSYFGDACLGSGRSL